MGKILYFSVSRYEESSGVRSDEEKVMNCAIRSESTIEQCAKKIR